MPKLPSGLHVGICNSPIIESIKVGDFKLQMSLLMSLRTVDDVKYLINIIYYHGTDANGMPTAPYQAGFSMHDVEQRKLGWSDDDYLAFSDWQTLPRTQTYLINTFEEIKVAIKNMKVDLPESLHGILEG